MDLLTQTSRAFAITSTMHCWRTCNGYTDTRPPTRRCTTAAQVSPLSTPRLLSHLTKSPNSQERSSWTCGPLLPFRTTPPPETPTSSLIAIPFHEPRHANHISYLETSIGPATLVLVRQLRLRQSPESTAHKHARRGKLDSEILEELELQETWRGAADLIENAVELATGEELDDDGCDVLYGRAGLVYALLLLRSELLVTVSYLAHAGKPGDKVVRAVEALCSDENIQALVDDIIKRGELGAARYAQELEADERGKAPPLMWKWHGSWYLGAAHGVGVFKRLF